MKGLSYKLLYKQSVEKDLRKLLALHRAQVVEKILALTSEPRPNGAVKLSGSLNLYRIRYGDYRIIYQINNEQLAILVVKVGHRREVYRTL